MEILNNYLISRSPQKTQLIPFGKPPRGGKPKGTLDFLGFTFYRGKSLKGYWVIKKQTARKRRNRFMRMLWHWCKENLHDPLRERHEFLCSKLRGFYQCFEVRGNYKVLEVELFDINPVTNTWVYDIHVLLNHKARLEVEGPLFENTITAAVGAGEVADAIGIGESYRSVRSTLYTIDKYGEEKKLISHDSAPV